MASYGLPYQGSKDKLVHKISACLPKGAENFYDLFGGGFAVSHFMTAHRKYPHVHYNEIEPSTVQLVKDAIAGKYNYKVFKPEWVTPEMFMERKTTCAYTRIIWSFGNNQKDYIFGKHIENDKRSLHNALVFDEFDDRAKELLDRSSFPENLSIRGRRLACRKIIVKKGKRKDLERLQQLEMSSLSYEKVKIKPNSVIYCDPPYKGTVGYTRSFDHNKFWQWVRECPHPVYISEYTAPDDIKVIAAFRHKKTNSQTTTDSIEKLYWNGRTINTEDTPY